MDHVFPDKMAPSRRPKEVSEPASRRHGAFPGTDGDNWHRALTGRQSPAPLTAKLRSIYGQVLTEKLPDKMVDLLSRLDQKAMDKE